MGAWVFLLHALAIDVNTTLRIKHVLAWWTRFEVTPRASQACTSGDVEVVAQNDGQWRHE